MSYRIKTYNQLTDKLFQEWQRLWDASPCAHFFNSPQWFSAFVKVYAPNPCDLMVIYENDAPVAFMPVVRQKKFGVKTLTCPGGSHLGRLPLLLKRNDPEVLGALFDHLSLQGSFYLPEAGKELMEAAKKSGRKFLFQQASVSPYFRLGQDPCSNFSKGRKQQVVRRVKKYRDRLSLKSYASDNLEGLEVAFVLDAQSAKREKGLLTFVDEQDRQYYRQLAKEFGEKVVVDVLFYDKEPVIFSVNFVCGKVYQFYKTAYHKSFGYLAPGKLLLYYRCPSLHDEGFDIFDFARGNSRFKREFGTLAYRQYDMFNAKNIFLRFWWLAAGALMQKKNELYENETYQRSYSARKKWQEKLKGYLKKST